MTFHRRCAIQKGSDETLAQKLRAKHKEHAYFGAPKREQHAFTVKHYAGDVTYLCAGFREKNKDSLHPDLAGVMQASALEFVRGLFPAAEVPTTPARPGGGGDGGGGGKKKKGAKSADRMTVASQFMLQLTSLMRTINETDVHYVRCIHTHTRHPMGAPPLTPHMMMARGRCAASNRM